MRGIRPEDIPRRNENIKWREFGTDGILLNPSSGDYFEVSEGGMMIWKHVDGRNTVKEIIAKLAAHFDANVADLTRDTSEFILELIAKSLISLES